MVKFIWIQLLGCALPTATSEVPLRFPGATVLHCASEKLFVSLSSPWALDWWGLMLMSLCSRSRLFGKVCYDVDDFAGKVLGGSRSWHNTQFATTAQHLPITFHPHHTTHHPSMNAHPPTSSSTTPHHFAFPHYLSHTTHNIPALFATALPAHLHPRTHFVVRP